MAAEASMTLSPASQGITVFPLPATFSSVFWDMKQLIMEARGSNPLHSQRGEKKKELQNTSSPSKKHQNNSLA